MWSLVAILILAADAPQFQAQLLDGQATVGRLTELDQTQLVLQTDSGPVTLPLQSVAAVSRSGAPAAQARGATLSVDLVDGSKLNATGFTVSAGEARVQLSDGAAVSIPARQVHAVRFSPPGEGKLTKQWNEILATKATGDLLVIRKNDSLDYLEGVLKDVTPEGCQFEVDGESALVKRAKVEGLVYFHPNSAELPEAVANLTTLDGSRLSVAKAALAEGALQVSTTGGAELRVPLAEVAALDYSLGKIAYLSDLEPEAAEYVPYLSARNEPAALRDYYHFRRDVGFEQSPLRLDGKTYRKGLALQSRTVLVYKLSGKFRRLEGLAGIDDSVRDSGSVRLEIKGDGKSLLQQEIKGSDPPTPLALDVGGVKRLEIVADFGGELDIGDRLDLCDLRVSK